MTGSGKMNRRVTLQRATVTADAFGGEVETWGTLAEVWVDRRDASAAESYRAQEVGAQITTRFKIRYSATVADLNPRDRLVYGGLAYQITGVRESVRNRWIEVDCVARPDIAAVETSP
jgi:SPP1 family predicted phage head-tail adaptor